MTNLFNNLYFLSDQREDYKFETDVVILTNLISLFYEKNDRSQEEVFLSDILNFEAAFNKYEINEFLLMSDDKCTVLVPKDEEPHGGLYNPALENLLEFMIYNIEGDLDAVDEKGDYWFNEKGIKKTTVKDLFELLESEFVYKVVIKLSKQ